MKRPPFTFMGAYSQAAAGIPKQGNILFVYEKPDVYGAGSGNWNENLDYGLGHTTASLYNGAALNGSGASANVRWDNATGADNKAIRIETTSDIDIQSFAIVFNTPFTHPGATNERNYFWDMRKANTESPDNGGFFNQYDGVAGGSTQIYANGEYWSYDESDGFVSGSFATNSTNLVNGSNNNEGGTATSQWLGPNARTIYTTKRLWLFNFNDVTPRPVALTTTGLKGIVIGNNDAQSEGASMGVYAMLAWDTVLDSSDMTALVDYFVGEGVLS